MSKNWIVSQLFYPEETSTAYIMTKIAEMLANQGNVNVICGSSNYQSKNLNAKNPLNKEINLVKIKTPPLDKNNIFYRIILFSFFTFSVLFKILLKVKKNDNVIVVTNPPTVLIIISFLKFFRKFKLFIILQDIFPENAAVSGLIKKKSFLYKISLNAMDFGYKNADHLIACGADMKDLFVNKGINPNKISVVPNWADNDLVDFDFNFIFNRNEYFNLDLNDKIVIEFAGNIGRVQGLESFIKIFRKSTNNNIVLLIIGDGAYKKLLVDYVCDNNIRNVYFFPSKPRNEQAIFLNSCDIGLVTLCDGMFGLGVPSKAYNLMSVSKPILYIGDKNSEIDRYISKNNIGWSFNWSEENEIVNFLNKIELVRDLNIQGTNARNFVLNNFTEDKILKHYKSILN
jgi:hypothetical protein